MNNPFKSENYKKNLDSLIKAVKLGNAEKQYNKTLEVVRKLVNSSIFPL